MKTPLFFVLLSLVSFPLLVAQRPGSQIIDIEANFVPTGWAALGAPLSLELRCTQQNGLKRWSQNMSVLGYRWKRFQVHPIGATFHKGRVTPIPAEAYANGNQITLEIQDAKFPGRVLYVNYEVPYPVELQLSGDSHLVPNQPLPLRARLTFSNGKYIKGSLYEVMQKLPRERGRSPLKIQSSHLRVQPDGLLIRGSLAYRESLDIVLEHIWAGLEARHVVTVDYETQQIGRFAGLKGNNGLACDDGKNGSHGQSVTLCALSQNGYLHLLAMTPRDTFPYLISDAGEGFKLDVRGGNGGHGGDGWDGCDGKDTAGEDGDDAGDGGRGGNGGSITVWTDEASLPVIKRLLSWDNSGGRGGNGGEGGDGGRGGQDETGKCLPNGCDGYDGDSGNGGYHGPDPVFELMSRDDLFDLLEAYIVPYR